MRPLSIQVLEPYAAVSHQLLWEGLAEHGRHAVRIDTLPPRRWKFRMRTASFHFARLLSDRAAAGEPPPDLLLCSEYLSVAEFLPLLPPAWRTIPVVTYFHENQLTYPLHGHERRDLQYAFSHLHAGLVSAHVLFNSEYHRRTFLEALPELLRPVPDVALDDLPARFAERSSVLPLGTAGPAGAIVEGPVEVPTVLWNHRWEYDKAPERFIEAVDALRADGHRFRVRLLGQRFREMPAGFSDFVDRTGDAVVGDGFVEDRTAYLAVVRAADIVVSTARHEFFGLSTLEALRSGLFPVLPDDLAYPELLPEEVRGAPFLYPVSEGLGPALATALATVAAGEEIEARRRILGHTDRFDWSVVAPAYDALFEDVVARARGA